MLAVVAVVLVMVALSVVCALKGKPLMALFGFVSFGAVALVGAVRLAAPGSWWEQRFYDGEQRDRARARGAEGRDEVDDERDAEILAAWEGVEIVEEELDPITRRALRRAGRL